MATKILEIVKGPPPPEDDRLVGLEIEVENFRCEPPPLEYWGLTGDGSLRNCGAEFVSRPLTSPQVEPAIEEVYHEWWKDGTWTETVRTGIHVHVDARDYDISSLTALVGTYCLLEPALFEFVGYDREECTYCVPWYRSTTDLDAFVESLRTAPDLPRFLYSMTKHTCKYSAFYLTPLANLGTVEFRQAPTWTTPTPLFTWTKMCRSIVDYAANQTINSILSKYEMLGPVEFRNQIIGPVVGVSDQEYENHVLKTDCEALAERLVDEESRGWKRIKTSFDDKPPVSFRKKIKPFGSIALDEPELQEEFIDIEDGHETEESSPVPADNPFAATLQPLHTYHTYAQTYWTPVMNTIDYSDNNGTDSF